MTNPIRDLIPESVHDYRCTIDRGGNFILGHSQDDYMMMATFRDANLLAEFFQWYYDYTRSSLRKSARFDALDRLSELDQEMGLQ